MRCASLMLLLLIWTADFSDAQTNETERPLSLAQCFHIALDHNFDVQIARFNPVIQQHNLSASYGAYEPVLASGGTRF